MFGLYRAGRWAAALSAFVALFAAPAHAEAGSRVQHSFAAAAPLQSAVQAPALPVVQALVQPAFAVPALVQALPQAVPDVQQVIPAPALPQPFDGASVPVQRTLRDMVDAFVDRADQDQEQLCLAKTIYFEARGESLEGQEAVAEVVLNRAASGRYPPTICGVVTQPSQFSFIRGGRFPSVDVASAAWRTALAIADVARNSLADQVPSYVLWYHANYVAPSWGRRLTRVARIGAHIFYG